jgi:methyl halide transferase
MMESFDEKYWTERYKSCQTGWDAGSITTPLKEFVDGLEEVSHRILIPGCGFGHEAEYLHLQGFAQVWVADLSQVPLDQLAKRVPTFPASHLLQIDFFAMEGPFDLILEQTFFCAIHPHLRAAYAQKVYDLLVPGGELVGVLFGSPFDQPGPPFGGTISEYRGYFQPLFEIITLEPCYNSIAPRQGNELFVRLRKPTTTIQSVGG